MKNEEILEKLNNIHVQEFSLDDFSIQLQQIKEGFVKEDKQGQAKQIWIYQTIIEIHSLYKKAFELLQRQLFYDAWCHLERIEIAFQGLKKHFSFNKSQFYLWQIEKNVLNLQILYPYKLFGSSEILKKKKKCSVCDKEISIRSSCGHIVGEIYNGEMCHRIVTEAEVLGLSLVQNPGNKYSVMFLNDPETGKQKDQYSYDLIDFLFELIESPYELWDLEVSQREISTSDFINIKRNDSCPCGSGQKFKKCCLNKVGEKYPHYEFILKKPPRKALLNKTIKIPTANSS